MTLSLIEYLSKIEDFRRKQGQRFPLPIMLLIIIMGIMSGRYGYRELGTFAKANQKELGKRLRIKKDKVPSYVTIREVIMNVDIEALNQAFYQWAIGYVNISRKEWISVDGKSIKSTVDEYDNAYQNFVCLVSLFSQKRGQVIKAETFENKKISEITVVQKLLETLDLKNVVLTLDALHCKKNSTTNHRKRK